MVDNIFDEKELNSVLASSVNSNNNNDHEEKPIKKFNMIDRYGEILTDKEYVTDPAIARDDEIRRTILTLFTPEKSPILVGKPGIGKTAIVEGIAYRIQKNLVPDALKGFKIIKINTVEMVGSFISDGNQDTKVQLLIDELEGLKNTILFIDETHTLVGNKENGGLDFANIFKPALARGDIKMIGATTSDEYDYYIVKDKAFLRRLEKIEIVEPSPEMTLKILMGTLPKIEKSTKVKFNYTTFITEQVMGFVVDLTKEYNRVFESASRYPDVCLLIITKMFSNAIFDNSSEVKFKHIWEAIKTTDRVYPDVIKKYKEIFKVQFSRELEEENVEI